MSQKVEAGTTGDGPATQKECDHYATMMNIHMDAGLAAAEQGDFDVASQNADEVDHWEQNALNRGCFVTHP